MVDYYLSFLFVGLVLYGCSDLVTLSKLQLFRPRLESSHQINRQVTILALITSAMIVALAVFAAEFNDLEYECRARAFDDIANGPLSTLGPMLVGLFIAVWGMVAASFLRAQSSDTGVAPSSTRNEIRAPFEHRTVLCWATWALLILSPAIIIQLISAADLVCYG